MTTTSTPSITSNHRVAKQGPETFDVVVIGGGQAGLAAGHYLAEQGLRFVILDAHDRVGDAWRNRWDSLVLFTPARYDSLPGKPFPGPRSAFPTKDAFADYLEQYASAMMLPIRNGIQATTVSRASGGGWSIETTGPGFVADTVIIATGGYQSPNIPEWASELDPEIVQLHSLEYRNPSQFRPGPVLVVGASHSGADIAVEAARDHRAILAGRDTGQVPVKTNGRLAAFLAPTIWFMVHHVVTVDTPIGRKAGRKLRSHGFPLEHPSRKDIAAAGVERVTQRVTGASNGKPMLDDGTVLDVSNVAWCTGFRGDYSWIEGVTYSDDGYPDQNHGVAAGAPGLYFVGLKFQTAGSSSLVGGVGRDAKTVVDHIAARAHQHA